MYIKNDNVLRGLARDRTFSRDVGVVIRIYSGVVERQIVLPSLGPCFSRCVIPNISPAVPARRNDDAVAVGCVRLVDELRTGVAELSFAPSEEGKNRR